MVFAITDITLPLPTSTPTTTSGNSIIYYLKVINSNLVDNSFGGLRNANVSKAQEINSKVGSSNSSSATNDSSITQTELKSKEVTWTDILPTESATIIFPKIQSSSGNHQLKVIFNPREWWGVRFVEVFDNGVRINCQSGFWTTAWNGLGLADSMVFGWGEGDEPCKKIIANNYIVEMSVSGESRKNIVLKSPIIPQSCPSSVSQNNAGNGYILNVSCE